MPRSLLAALLAGLASAGPVELDELGVQQEWGWPSVDHWVAKGVEHANEAETFQKQTQQAIANLSTNASQTILAANSTLERTQSAQDLLDAGKSLWGEARSSVQDSLEAAQERAERSIDRHKAAAKNVWSSLKQGASRLGSRGWESIKGMGSSANDMYHAARDTAFRKALVSLELCPTLEAAIQDAAPRMVPDIANRLTTMQADPATQPKACMAEADSVAIDKLRCNVSAGIAADTAQRAAMLFIERGVAVLCDGEDGLKAWLAENAQGRTSDPVHYSAELSHQLDQKLEPLLTKYLHRLCHADDTVAAFSLFGGGLPLGRGRARAAVLVPLAAAGGVLVGLAALRAKKSGRRLALAEADDLETPALE